MLWKCFAVIIGDMSAKKIWAHYLINFIILVPTKVWTVYVKASSLTTKYWTRLKISSIVKPGNTKGGKYHCTIELLLDWFGLVCFANKNKNWQLSYSWFQISQTGGQWYSDTSPFSIPWSNALAYYARELFVAEISFIRLVPELQCRMTSFPTSCLEVWTSWNESDFSENKKQKMLYHSFFPGLE